MRDAKDSDPRSQGEKCAPSNGGDREQNRKKQVSGQMGGVETGPIESIIAKVRLLPDVGWGPSEGSRDGNEEPTESPGERDKGDEKEWWKSRGDGRLFMDWESGDGLCRRAFPNLGGCQTRHGKHLKVNNRKNIITQATLRHYHHQSATQLNTQRFTMTMRLQQTQATAIL